MCERVHLLPPQSLGSNQICIEGLMVSRLTIMEESLAASLLVFLLASRPSGYSVEIKQINLTILDCYEVQTLLINGLLLETHRNNGSAMF